MASGSYTRQGWDLPWSLQKGARPTDTKIPPHFGRPRCSDAVCAFSLCMCAHLLQQLRDTSATAPTPLPSDPCRALVEEAPAAPVGAVAFSLLAWALEGPRGEAGPM